MIDIDFTKLGPKLLKKRKSVLTVGLVKGDNTNPYAIRVVFPEDATSRDDTRVQKFLNRFNIKLGSTIIPRTFKSDDNNFLSLSNVAPTELQKRQGISPRKIQSGESVGNLSWFTNGTISGILEIKIDNGTPKKYLLSLHHVLIGEAGSDGESITFPSVRFLLGQNYDQNIIGKTTDLNQEPEGVEWALGDLSSASLSPEIINLNGLIPNYNGTSKPDIGDYVVKSGIGSKVTYGQVTAIHVFAQAEDGGYLQGFEIEPMKAKKDKTTGDIVGFKKSNKAKAFAKNADSGSLIIKMDKIGNIYEPNTNPIGMLVMITAEEGENEEYGYAIYFDEVIKDIEKYLKSKHGNQSTISINFIK